MPNTLGIIFVSLIRCLFVAPLEDVTIKPQLSHVRSALTGIVMIAIMCHFN